MFWAAFGLLWGTGAAACAWPYSIDDAFIVARYALRIAHGASYTFNDGPPTDGVTGPLWLLPLVVGTRLGADPLLVAKGLGWACTAAAVLLMQRRLSGRAYASTSVAAFAVLAASAAPLWIWAIAGLETGAATLAASAVLLGATRRPAPCPWLLGAGAAALAWLRPEHAPLVVCMLSFAWWRSPRAIWPALGIACLGALSVLGFRFICFDALLPLSASAKPPLLANGAAYALRSAAQPAALALVPALLAAWQRGRADDRVVLAAVLVHASAVVLAGGDWMPGARLFVPLIPALCLIAAVGLARLWLRRRALAAGLLLLMLGVRVTSCAGELARAHAAGMAREQRLPELLRALDGVSDPVAVLDIGAIGYRSGRTLIDLGGLTEPSIGRAPGGHLTKRIDSEWLRQRAPGAIVLHSAARPRVDDAGRLRWYAGYPVERRVLGMPWVQAGYRVKVSVEYQPDYFYAVLVPRGSGAP